MRYMILISLLFGSYAYAQEFKYNECDFVFSPPSSGPKPDGYNVYVRHGDDLRKEDVGLNTRVPCEILIDENDNGDFVAWAKSYIGDKESTRSPIVPFEVSGDIAPPPPPSDDDPMPPATFEVILR